MTFIQMLYAAGIGIVAVVIAFFKKKADKATKKSEEADRLKNLAIERLKEKHQQVKIYEASERARATTRQTVKNVDDSLKEVKQKAKEGKDADTQQKAINMATDIFNGSGTGKL